MKRYALVRGARDRQEAEAYLPGNYSIIHQLQPPRQLRALVADKPTFVIAGEDRQGWTLDSYVIPRYASGLIGCEEIDLSHPVMKQVPA